MGAAEGSYAVVFGALGLPAAAGLSMALFRHFHSLLVASAGRWSAEKQIGRGISGRPCWLRGRPESEIFRRERGGGGARVEVIQTIVQHEDSRQALHHGAKVLQLIQ